MKITGLKTFVVDAFRANYVFVKILTDEGIYGVGEGTVEMKERTVAAAIDELSRYLVGKNPFQIQHHVEMMNRDSYWRTGIILRSALAAVEAALLDIKGKALGVPVYDLLGGRQRDEIQCYANGWFVGARTPAEFAEKAKLAVTAGFHALKWDPFGSSYLAVTPADRYRAIDIVAAVRDAVGKDVDLMIEGHGRFNVPTAISFARDLAPFDPYWFEEPVPPESIDALADVRSKSPIAIAAGERYYEPARFAELIRRSAVDYLQPDVSHVGGLTEAKRIADAAHTHYLPVAPHNPLGPIANAMSLHLAAATANVIWLETMMTDVSWRGDVAIENVSFANGAMKISDAPGLGIDLDEAACARHPYKHYDLRHYQGTLTDIRPPDARPFYAVSESVGAAS